jgi:hypothetical protein
MLGIDDFPKFPYCQNYWKHKGKETRPVIYLAYVGDMTDTYKIAVAQLEWRIPLYGWYEFILYMLQDWGNCICKWNTLHNLKHCLWIFLCLVLSQLSGHSL